MASFTTVGDSVELTVSQRGEDVAVAISGTYSMTISLQKQVGSKGSGAWRTIETWSTANATVAYTYTTTDDNETVRLIVDVDTSGTATATLTDATVLDHSSRDIKDPVGNDLLTFDQNGMTLFRAVRRSGGAVAVTASTTLTASEHAGRVVVVNAAAGATITLPAATGTGDEYTVFCGTTVTSNDLIVEVANSTDILAGGIAIATDVGGIVENTAATDDTITMNGTTTGGVIGSWVRVVDAAAGFWLLDGFLVSSGAEATAFSAAV